MENDPRLKIPDELTTPLDRSRFPSASPKQKPAGKADAQDGTMQQLARISVVGTNFVLAVFVLGLIGWALQTWVLPRSAPWLLVGGLLLGVIVGAFRFVQDARKLL